MIGAALLVLAFLVFVPVMLTSLAVVAGVLGTSLTKDAERRYEGSELLGLGD